MNDQPKTASQLWDPFATLRGALWIGSGQWAGKSTATRLLADRYGLTTYHYDYHDARAHNDRRIARRVKLGQPPTDPDPDEVWVNTTLENMAAETLAGFPTRFEWALDDLRALVSGRPIIDSPRRMVVMVPTEEFRQHQLHQTARASALSHRVSNPERAQHKRLTRDRLVTEDAVRSTRRFGIRTIEVNESHDTGAIADILADHFRPYLPPSDRHRA